MNTEPVAPAVWRVIVATRSHKVIAWDVALFADRPLAETYYAAAVLNPDVVEGVFATVEVHHERP